MTQLGSSRWLLLGPILVLLVSLSTLTACGGDDAPDRESGGAAGGSGGKPGGPDAGEGTGGSNGGSGASGGTAGTQGTDGGGTAGTDDGGGEGGAVVASVAIVESEFALAPGDTVTLTAHAYDAAGQVVAATITWQSANPSIATIVNGAVSGVALGQTSVTASAGAITSAPVTVWVNPAGTMGQALSRAVLAGEITANEALVYRIFYVHGDSRFPGKYRGTVNDEGADDLLMLEADRRFASLTVAQQDAITPYFYPPAYRATASTTRSSVSRSLLEADTRPPCETTATGSAWTSVDSTHFRVWYDKVTNPGHAAKAQQVSQDAETAYVALVQNLGFLAPLGDGNIAACNGSDARFDIYIAPLNGVNGHTTPQVERPGGTFVTFITIVPTAPRRTTAHEFMHAIQAAYPNLYSTRSYDWSCEATATWASFQVFPAEMNDYAASFLRRVNEPLFYPNQYCATGSAGPACVADGSGDLKMYGAYLFFQYAVNKTTTQNHLVRGFFEQAAVQPDSLAALDTVLIAAGQSGLTATWPKFVLALWNRDPIPQGDSFRGWDWDSKTWQAVTNTTANLDLQNVTLTATDPNKVSAPTKLQNGGRANTALNELSATYERYQFGGNVRSVVFFNGYSQQLTKLAIPVRADIGPVRHTAQLNGGQFFTNFGGTEAEMKGRQVWALRRSLPASGTSVWTLEDWTAKPAVSLCFDKLSERIEELVLIFTNGNFTTARSSAFEAHAIEKLDQERSTIIASQTPCYKYEGKADALLEYKDTNDTFTLRSSLIASYVAEFSTVGVTVGNRAGTAFPGFVFTADPAKLVNTVDFNATLKSCGPGYVLNDTFNLGGADFPVLPAFTTWLPESTAQPFVPYAYSGQGRAIRIEAEQCLGRTKLLPAVNRLDFDLDFTKFQTIDVAPGRLQSAAEVPGPVYDQGEYPNVGNVKNTWCLAAIRQDLQGKDIPPTACP
jgi:hypothetical protein